MLKLQNITKVYEIGKKKSKDYQKVDALKGVSLEFRKSEFVSILGPSGCGKTTLLNIIGGLDKYTDGDLIINNKSTKEFKDKDWDNYRNHSIGFVFQSYNLIPHQTILQNVELALTLSGVNKEERKKRAAAVLAKVGLKDKLNSKPNQLSGGQMQRVAIARALVNDPDIILADEPTGALDSKTSEQVIDLLKEISKEKLIIMVTHNPELAEKYSSRIIRLLDGKVVNDSLPYEAKEGKSEKLLSVAADSELSAQEKKVKNKKTRMSFFTALSLSFKNLLTKKTRTILVSFAGSIGIIGIALILALSSGFQGYINKVQEDSLSSYPITIQKNNFNMASMLTSMFKSSEDGESHDDNAVYSSEAITSLFNTVAGATKPNDLKSFYAHLQENYDDIKNSVNAVQYTYNFNYEIYNKNKQLVAQTSHALYDIVMLYAINYFAELAKITITPTTGGYVMAGDENSSTAYLQTYLGVLYSTYVSNGNSITLTEEQIIAIIDSVVFGGGALGSYSITQFEEYPLGAVNEMLDNNQLIKSQYEIVAGDWMESDNDLMLVLDKHNEIDDYILYALGLASYEQVENSIQNLVKKQSATMTINYDDILNSSAQFKMLLGSDYYNASTDSVVDKDDLSSAELSTMIDNGRTLTIKGIIRPTQSATNACLTPGLVYSKSLSNAMITEYNNSTAVTNNKLTRIDTTDPSKILIYVKDFDSKKVVTGFIDDYNKNVEEGKQLTYDDSVDIMMSSVSTIINAITYVLVAFVAISLVVSSIMIGIITYISVIERTKEIGVLRAIGASKRDVKRVFTAESLIIGFAAGILGIGITLLLTIPINIIIKSLTQIGNVAVLPVLASVILVAISMLLTFVAGLVPAKIASKKDPVTALRSE